jgi:hypothetical protein
MQTIHICLISGYILPNLIPALMDQNIAGVISFSGDGQQQKQRKLLVELLDRRGVTLLKSVKANNSFDLPTLLHCASELKAWLEDNASDKIWKINVTGGTKPMALAIFSVFQNHPNSEIIYQDTQSLTLRNLTDTSKDQANHSVIDYETYLAAQRFNVTQQAIYDQDDVDHILARKWIIDKVFMPNMWQIWQFTTLFNTPASRIKSKNGTINLTQPLRNGIKLNAARDKLLKALEPANLFTLNQDNKTITFFDEDAAAFLGGGWLEEYAYWCAVDAGIEYVGLNVFGEWDMQAADKPSSNEFDVVCCHNNQLLVIECKALAFNDEVKGQDVVNKIEALKSKAGGIFGKSMLVASDELSENNQYTQHIVQRLKDYKIDLIQNSNLKQLTERLSDWQKKCDRHLNAIQ